MRDAMVAYRHSLRCERERAVARVGEIESLLLVLDAKLALEVDQEGIGLMVSIDRATSRGELSPREAEVVLGLVAQGLVMTDMRMVEGVVRLAWALTARGREVVRELVMPAGEKVGE